MIWLDHVSNCVGSGELHLGSDRARARTSRAPREDAREGEHIVDLIWIVGAAGANEVARCSISSGTLRGPSSTRTAVGIGRARRRPISRSYNASTRLFVAALEAEGVDVHFAEPVKDRFTKAIYTRDPLICVRGGVIVG
jgi:hypothetical protein